MEKKLPNLNLQIIKVLCLSSSVATKVLVYYFKISIITTEVLVLIFGVIWTNYIFSEYESRYNPFFYFYTQQQRDQAMSNMMSPVKQVSPSASKVKRIESFQLNSSIKIVSIVQSQILSQRINTLVVINSQNYNTLLSLILHRLCS